MKTSETVVKPKVLGGTNAFAMLMKPKDLHFSGI